MSGCIGAYAILCKVFEFIRDMRKPVHESGCHCKAQLEELQADVTTILRLVTRLRR